MANNTRSGIKKSNFAASTTIPDSGTLDYVYNNQNIKITYSDFLGGLGVTGSIEQEGNPSGSPVLDKQGTLNAIRNLVGGFGITTTIDSQNSIELATDFAFDQTAVTAVENVSAETPRWRSFQAGQDINITGTGGVINISANTDGLKAENQIIVNQIEDFGTPSGGEYALLPDTEYYIGSQLTISDALRVGDGTVIKGSRYPSSITYDGSGGMFRGVDSTCQISELTIDCPSATAFSFSDSSSASIVNVSGITVVSCNKIAEVSGLAAFTVEESNALNYTQGIEIVGTGMDALSIQRFACGTTSASATAVDLGTNVFNTLELQNIAFIGVPGGVAISGATSNANISAGQIAAVSNCEFIGGLTQLSGITVDDFRYNFSGNSGLKDTNPDALLSLNNNSTATTISAVNTPVKVAGTWVVEQVSHFSGDATGRATYDAEKAVATPITISVGIAPISGTNKDMTVYVNKNGSVVANSAISARGDSGDPRTITLVWQDNLMNADYIELWVENNSDAVDLLVSNAVMRLR